MFDFYMGVTFSFFIFYCVFYNFLAVLMLLEVLMMFLYCFLSVLLNSEYSVFFAMMLFSCFMVLEGVVGLCLLMSHYRLVGVNYFSLW